MQTFVKLVGNEVNVKSHDLKQHFFRGADRLAVLQRGLLKVTAQQGWHLKAWAIFSNHYHFVAHSPSDQDTTGVGLRIVQ